MSTPKPKTYLVKNGLNYTAGGVERRAEPGDLVDDLPASAVAHLLERGHIADPPKKKGQS